jgi:hypothetical protein
MPLEEGVVNARKFYVGESLRDPQVPPLLFTFDEVAEHHIDHLCPAVMKPIIEMCEHRLQEADG